MRLKVSMVSANEDLVALINNGYEVLGAIRRDYAERKRAGSYDKVADIPRYSELIKGWEEGVIEGLTRVFPTSLEASKFLNPNVPLRAVSGDYEYQTTVVFLEDLVRGLDSIRQGDLLQYTDLPVADRLYVEDIDSFCKVRDINPARVASLLQNGLLSLQEEQVQLALEQILGVSFHRKDWAGEVNDLFTSNVIVNGRRRATAFLLKGQGVRSKELSIADCGRNGDQIVRLFQTPADLFVIQHVGPVADALITDVQGKTTVLRGQGKTAHFLVLDGQDTARLMVAYGKLKAST
jgi:hypothetical protein